MAPDSDSQTVKLVKPNPLHRTGLSIGEDRDFTDKLCLGLARTRRGSWTRVLSELAWDDPESEFEAG
jgi:hypothetical protein